MEELEIIPSSAHIMSSSDDRSLHLLHATVAEVQLSQPPRLNGETLLQDNGDETEMTAELVGAPRAPLPDTAHDNNVSAEGQTPANISAQENIPEQDTAQPKQAPHFQLQSSSTVPVRSTSLDGVDLFAFDSDDEERWSRSPSPTGNAVAVAEKIADDNGWDAAHEIDVSKEEGEFARFVSQVKGKDISTVQKEIDEEIRTLNLQRKAALRDSEDVTQAMIAQIMVSVLFLLSEQF